MDGVFGLAALILSVAPNYSTILAGRFLSGCASGISLVAAVSYLTELASAEQNHAHRGALVSTVEASVSLGFLVSYVASYALTVWGDYEEGWRILFGVGTGFLAWLQWVGMMRMPESPVWLAENGFHDKAHAALRRITPRNSLMNSTGDDMDDLDGSMGDRAAVIEAEMRNPSRLDEQRVPFEYGEAPFIVMDDIPSISHYWRQAIIVAVLAIAEQFCGHINIMTYAPIIFAEVFYNYDEEKASEEGGAIASELLATTIILGVVKFIITTFVLFEVDKLGRRFLLKAGAGIVAVSLFFLAVGFSVQFEGTVVTENNETEYIHTAYQKELVLIGSTGVVAGFALSYGPITWLVTAELSPSSIRGRMLGFYQVLTHGCAALVSYTFLSGQEKHGNAFPFWLYFFCSVASFIFIIVAVPETGGVAGADGEDVESLLDDTRFWSKDNPILKFGRFVGCAPNCMRSNNRSREELGRIDSCFDDVDGPIDGSGIVMV